MLKKLLFLCCCLPWAIAIAQPKTPAQLYPQLFKDVQMAQVFADGKTFADATALKSAAEINRDYALARQRPQFNLASFVKANFIEPAASVNAFKTDTANNVYAHIDTLWTVLQRHADTSKNTSLLPLPYPYIVPGGRFREIYYWDSYFTMLGLKQDKKYDVIRNMVRNFAWLIDEYGHIPNGNRSYYLTRSQPPFFSLMVELLAGIDGDDVYVQYQPQLIKEYHFWMKGAQTLKVGQATARVFRVSTGAWLNRYWDDSNAPRDESYREDVLAAKLSAQPEGEFYRNIRAAAESGWDFSSRWFADGKTLQTIETTSIIPVDLNCLLYKLETVIAKAYAFGGDKQQANIYSAKAATRRAAILKFCWDARTGFFKDYNWQKGRLSPQMTAAATFPLFVGIATAPQASKVARVIKQQFVFAGGVATTLLNTGQQWDRPNGWAPLQYVTIVGLRNYHHDALAKKIATSWIEHNLSAFKQTGKLLEKYNVELKGDAAKAGGGEYPLQDGFGWTNGVLLQLMSLYK